jgi:NAD(P)-dependent dehydrogenase (short-subunit alcohol dehydrogenase family)
VIIGDVDREDAGGVAELGGETAIPVADLTSGGAMRSSTRRSTPGPVRHLVNNAGYRGTGPIHKVTDEQFEA